MKNDRREDAGRKRRSGKGRKGRKRHQGEKINTISDYLGA